MIIKQSIRNSIKFYEQLYIRSFSNLIFILNRTETSGPRVIKENTKYRFEERKEKSTFIYPEKRSKKEKYGANKLEALTPFELFCIELKESSNKVPSDAKDEMEYLQKSWDELDDNAREKYIKLLNIQKESKIQETIV